MRLSSYLSCALGMMLIWMVDKHTLDNIWLSC